MNNLRIVVITLVSTQNNACANIDNMNKINNIQPYPTPDKYAIGMAKTAVAATSTVATSNKGMRLAWLPSRGLPNKSLYLQKIVILIQVFPG